MNTIRPGSLAYWRNDACVVLEIKGLTEAVIRTVAEKTTHVVRASELALSPNQDVGLIAKHVFAENQAWDLATERYELIRPLLGAGGNSFDDVKRVADASGKSTATIYRWIQRFNETGLVSSLLRTARSDSGSLRLDEEVEHVMHSLIQTEYLKAERPTAAYVYRLIEAECYKLGIVPPHINTLHQRIRAIDEKERCRRRLGPRAASHKHNPLRGSFPETIVPNALVQIDHTPVDLTLVDEQHRLPIGRPYLTMCIDVHTRMITGFCLTLDPPSSTSAALAITHAVMKKDYWLAKMDIHAEWPIYGKMQTIHVDNASEFRGKALGRGCDEHGISLEWRPKGQPNYGPHIERAFRTFMEETHNIPGTTFSNVRDKRDYDSEGRACFTLRELELWITIYIVYCYHNSAHEGICDFPPINFYARCVHGTSDAPGVGLPEAIDNEEKFRIDFLPFEEKTVQRKGVVWDYIHYYAPVLKNRIVEKDARGGSRKFVFARDPRDISVIYFLDPESETYHPIPYFNANRPPISIWELNSANRRIKSDPHAKVDENSLFEGVQRLREIEKEAIEKTRLAKNARASEKRKRRMSERRRGWTGVHKTQSPTDSGEPVAHEADEPVSVEPFDIEMGYNYERL